MGKRMNELSTNGLSLLQQVGAGGLIASILTAGVCAFLLLAAGNEQDRRQVASTEQAVRSARAEGEMQVLQGNAALRVEAKATRGEVEALRTAAAEAAKEAERLALVNVSLERRLAAGGLAADGSEASEVMAEGERDSEAVGASVPARVLAPEVLAALRPENARKLAATQAAALKADLGDHAGEFSVEVTSAPDEEARLYAAQLAAAFRQAGIPTQGPYGVLTTLKGEGVFVSTEGPGGDLPGATVLSALQNASLPARPAPDDADSATFLLPEGSDVRVYVGGAPGA